MHDLYLCNACGQITRIERHNTLCNTVPQWCPYCGAKGALTAVRSSFGGFTAACFAIYDKQLVALLYEQWGVNHNNEKIDYPHFIDYIRALTEGDE